MTPEQIRNLKEQCLGYETRTDLMRKDPALYARIHYHNLAEVCFQHMPVHRRRWAIEELVREAKKYTTRTEMLAENPGLYQAITRRGLTQLLPPSRRGQKK